jgi:glyoxylase-like metal-dependent hydrolase (beta-lactamase superfamily II)
MGLRVAFAAETHLHADFVSGGRELAARGATLLAPAGAKLAFEHQPLEDGAEIALGGLTLRAVATPGHTPEHLSYVINDGARPLAAFTGGALIVGSVARTDLISPEETERLTRAAYRSARKGLGSLPDDVAVYPTHGAGSFCSAPGSTARTTSVGQERKTNNAFTAVDEDAFVSSFLAGLGSYPPYFLRLRAANRRGPTVLADCLPTLTPLCVDDVQRLIEEGAEVIDARPFEGFAAGHVPGSISIELRPQFASWLGWVAHDDRPLVSSLPRRRIEAMSFASV